MIFDLVRESYYSNLVLFKISYDDMNVTNKFGESNDEIVNSETMIYFLIFREPQVHAEIILYVTC